MLRRSPSPLLTVAWPALDLNFARDKALPGFAAYTGQNGTVVNASGVIVAATTNQARFDHTYAGVSRGVLIEEARTNLIVRSDALNNASWQTGNATITANDRAAPDGATSAEKFTATAQTAYANQAVAVSAQAYTLSGFGRPVAAGDYLALLMQPQYSDRVGSRFDLNAGTVIGATANGASSAATARIATFADGWLRGALTATLASNAGARHYLGASDSTQSNSDPFNSSTLRSIHTWGAQLEVGSFPTSYIPTAGSTVTRTLDALSIPTSAYQHNATEGAIVFSGSIPILSTTDQTLFELSDGTSSNLMRLRSTSSGAALRCSVVAGGVAQVGTNTANGFTAGAVFAGALLWSTNSFAFVLNNGTVVTGTGTVPTVTALRVGSIADGTLALNGHARTLTVYNRRPTTAEIQAKITALLAA